ncbi:MAG: S53 family peptidase [Terracidiphilus sp.]|jgi:kumamolisin
MANSKKVALIGSERVPLAGARAIGPTDPHQLVEISVILKHRQPLDTFRPTGKFMSHSEFAAQFGAEPAHIDMIKRFAQENKLQMLERGDEVMRRTVTLAGTAANMEKAFGIELIDYDHPDGYYRGRTGAIQLPEEIAPFVKGVFGLDDRPVAKPHFRYRNENRAFGVRASNKSFSPTDVAKLYDFPQDVNGTGQVIGLIELGGGYRPADIEDYFQSIGMPAPRVKTSSVDQAKNRPSTAQSADGEVMLDIEVAGAVAPGAMIVAYFAPNTTRGFQDALSMAVHDQLRKPIVISISWGGPESGWTDQSMQNFDDVAQEAGLLGITITVAAGDSGSSDGVNDGKNHVDFPASCPHVLAAGGTRLTAANGVITSETVWNDGEQGGATGGGFSTFFARPDWQSNDVHSPNRGVPDVAGNADPDSGYNVLVDGQQMVVGGTSAVAPLWAGLIALLSQKLQSRIGFINQTLYNLNESTCFHDITSGSNGAFSAGTGWDPTTGLGSPVGIQLTQAFQGAGSQAHAHVEKGARTHPTSSR